MFSRYTPCDILVVFRLFLVCVCVGGAGVVWFLQVSHTVFTPLNSVPSHISHPIHSATSLGPQPRRRESSIVLIKLFSVKFSFDWKFVNSRLIVRLYVNLRTTWFFHSKYSCSIGTHNKIYGSSYSSSEVIWISFNVRNLDDSLSLRVVHRTCVPLHTWLCDWVKC